LIYGTGGLAYGRVGVSGNTIISETSTGLNSGPPFAIPPSGSQFDAFKTNVRFAVGGGIEGKWSYLLPAGWTWKVEYLYLDLGSLNTGTTLVPTTFPGSGGFTNAIISAQTGAIHTHFHRQHRARRAELSIPLM